MAPLAKRRKLDENDVQISDDSSFASFGSEDEAGGSKPTNGESTSLTGPEDEEDGTAVANLSDGSESIDENADSAFVDEDAPDQAKPSQAEGKIAAEQHMNPDRQARMSNGGHVKKVPAPRRTALNASVLDVQLDQLLSQVRPRRGKREDKAEKALREIKGILERLEAIAAKTIVDAERHLIKTHRVAIPFPEPRPSHDLQYKLEYQPPAAINVTGSYATQVYLRSSDILTIDMMVQMPDSLFQDKDYLDHRYFYRRSYYLACLAAVIQTQAAASYKISFDNHNGNPLSPILVVVPLDAQTGPGKKAWRINILPHVSTKIFSDERLLPSKISVRSIKTGANDKDTPSNDATAFYNSSIQSDRQMTPYLRLVHSASTTCDDFKDACLLFRVWLRQRGLDSSVQGGGFGNFEATALIAVLLAAGVLSPRYNAFQLFKASLQYLVTKDCLKAPVIIGDTSLELQSVNGQPIMFDADRSHNVLYKMTAWSYKSLRTLARSTVSSLAGSGPDAFDSSFISRADALHLSYDLCLTIPNQLLATGEANDHEVLTYRQKLYAVLARGLADRATHLNLKTDQLSPWTVGSARPSWRTKGETIVCISLNAATASRTIDLGPSAENTKEAADFRTFWGDKAELRRFKDGSILESLVWTGKGEESVTLEIVQYLIERHFGAGTAASLRSLDGSVSKMIPHMSGVAAFSPAMEAFKTLESDIRALDELPLTIRQMSDADPQLRFASITPPSASGKSSAAPMDVVIQFESSSRWPDDLQAVQRVKAAFLLKVASLLQEANSSVDCRVGLENTASPSLNQVYLDVTYPTPLLTFRVRICHDREPAILQTLLKNKSTPPPLREEAAAALAIHRRDFLALPVHTATIVRQATRLPALSPTIRLLKKWFSAHHLSSHFPEPIIELFALHALLHPAPYTTPNTAKTGLYRTLLLLSKWNWRTDPLLLPPTSLPNSTSNTTTASDTANPDATGPRTRDAWLANARTRFQAWRRLDPSLNRVVLFLASEADPDGTLWTDISAGGPSRVAAARMSALASAAVDEITGNEIGLEPERLFVSGVGDFDFVVRLDLGIVGGGRGKRKYKNLEEGDGAFDPVGMFLDEIGGLYGSSLVLFHGGKGSDVVGGLWNPVSESRAWKVNLAWSTVPVVDGEGEAQAKINKQGILAEIGRLGGDMISKIEMKS